MCSVADQQYAEITEKLNWEKPTEYVDDLRKLVGDNHRESMSLLAILLGDIDSYGFRSEIINLYEQSYSLGSPVAANDLAIQYEQWGEIENANRWRKLASEREDQ